MKLFDYVLENEEGIEELCGYNDFSPEEFLMSEHCPSGFAFGCLRGTKFHEVPYPKNPKEEYSTCTYNNINIHDKNRCKECWNRNFE